MRNDGTLYIPSVLNSYFLDKLRRLPAAGSFKCLGERPEFIAYKIWGDTSLDWIIKYYNNITHPFDGSTAIGKELLFPSLNSVEKLFATLNAKQRALEKENNA